MLAEVIKAKTDFLDSLKCSGCTEDPPTRGDHVGTGFGMELCMQKEHEASFGVDQAGSD